MKEETYFCTTICDFPGCGKLEKAKVPRSLPGPRWANLTLPAIGERNSKQFSIDLCPDHTTKIIEILSLSKPS
jgi:hypothetical protein